MNCRSSLGPTGLIIEVLPGSGMRSFLELMMMRGWIQDLKTSNPAWITPEKGLNLVEASAGIENLCWLQGLGQNSRHQKHGRQAAQSQGVAIRPQQQLAHHKGRQKTSDVAH